MRARDGDRTVANRARAANRGAGRGHRRGSNRPTNGTGAFASPDTVAEGERAGVSAATALTCNDSYKFSTAAGGLFVTGPSGTNVSDVFFGLVNY